MSRIRFIEASFPDPDESRYSIEERFTKFLRKLRLSDGETEDPVDEDEAETIARPGAGAKPKPLLTDADHRRIGRRAASLAARKEANSGLAHLRREERDQLKPLSNGAQLIEIRSDDHADQLAAQLHAELPWMAAATTEVWQAMRRSVREGQPGLRLPPLLLDGPPGIGKSHWARRLGQLLGSPVTVIEATAEQASFGIVGSQRGWGGACPGRLIQTILKSVIGNPVIVVDEVEKAGQATSRNGHTFGLAESLLPLLEPMTARGWSCPYY